MQKLVIQESTICKHVSGLSITQQITLKLICNSAFREPATGLSCLPLYVSTRLYIKLDHIPYYCMRVIV